MDANASQGKSAAVEGEEPLVTQEAMVFTVTWPRARIGLEFHRLVSARNGDVSAEIRVGRLADGTLEVVHQSRLNLTSAGARDQIARLLGSTLGRQDLLRYIDAACTTVLELSRTGEPAIILREAPAAPLAEYAIEPLVLARHPTVWFGDGGTGKSVLALAAASAIHTGSPFVGIPIDRPRRVLYLDWELEAASQRARLEALHGDAMPDLVYARCTRPLADEAERVSQIIRERDIEFVVIDSIAAACGGEPEAAITATSFAAVLAQVCPAALCLAHTTKDGATAKPFGSTFWHNLVRSTWYVNRAAAGTGTLEVELHSRKTSFSATSAPVGIELTFDAGRIWLQRTEVSVEASKPKVIDRLRAASWDGFKTYHALAELIEADKDAVSKALDRNPTGFTFIKKAGAQVLVAKRVQLQAVS